MEISKQNNVCKVKQDVTSAKFEIMHLKFYIIICCFLFASCTSEVNEITTVDPVVEQEVEGSTDNFTVSPVTFDATDGLVVSADLFEASANGPSFILSHQAGFNRTENTEAAVELMSRGYNVLTTDQRSGGTRNGADNETADRAEAEGFPSSFLDAEQDIIAAIDFMVDRYDQQVILLGSSYSSSLALKIANENDHVQAVLAFSPGEYFGSALNLESSITGLDKPTFITSARGEASQVQPFVDVIDPSIVTHFVPQASGSHGAVVLSSDNSASEEYWTALNAFLTENEL